MTCGCGKNRVECLSIHRKRYCPRDQHILFFLHNCTRLFGLICKSISLFVHKVHFEYKYIKMIVSGWLFFFLTEYWLETMRDGGFILFYTLRGYGPLWKRRHLGRWPLESGSRGRWMLLLSPLLFYLTRDPSP